LTILVAAAVITAAATGVFGYQTWVSSSPSPASDPGTRSLPATSPATMARQDGDVPQLPPPGSGDGRGDREGVLGAADGAIPTA
jgi:hypothetical protein